MKRQQLVLFDVRPMLILYRFHYAYILARHARDNETDDRVITSIDTKQMQRIYLLSLFWSRLVEIHLHTNHLDNCLIFGSSRPEHVRILRHGSDQRRDGVADSC